MSAAGTASDVGFRLLVEADIESVHACMDAIAKEKKFFIRQAAPPLESFRSFLLDKLAHGSPCVVAVDGERIVGYCDLMRLKSPGFTHVAKLGLGVLKAYRGQGIGRALLKRAIATAQEMEVERLELEVFASNHVALHLYQSFGFEIEGVKQKMRKVNDAYEALIQMALFFESD